MNEDNGINGMVQSALTILLVFLVTPLITGGAIGLAVDFGDEKIESQTPQDTNGFKLYNSDCPNTLPGYTVGTTSNPTSTQSITQTTAPSNSYTQQDYTRLTYSHGNQPGGSLTCHGATDRPDTIIFPPNTIPYDAQHTTLVVEFFTGSSMSSGTWATLTLDAKFKIDNQTFLEIDDIRYSSSTSSTKQFMRIDHTYSITELNDLINLQEDCETICEVYLQLEITDTFCPTSYCGNGYMSQTQYIKVESYSSDDISSELVMTIAPWVLGGIYMIIALASTPLWNPIFSKAKNTIIKRYQNV